MNLRDLEYVVAVAETLNFGKAAERCNVSQPTLSGQIKKLEEYLGVPLFERDNKRVAVTAVGQEVARRAREVLQGARDLVECAKNGAHPLGGEYRLGAFPTLAPYLLPEIIASSASLFPELRVVPVEEKSAELIASLKKGKIDAALLALPLEEDGLIAKALFDDPFYLAAAKDHPLATVRSVTAKEFARYRPMLLEEGHCLREQALDVCRLAGAHEGAFKAAGLETLRRMTAAGHGVTLMPAIACEKTDEGSIAYVPFDAPAPSRRIALARRARSTRTEAFSALAGVVTEAANKKLGP
ncbi:MAG: LysR substrate-binding domain-containing protein [Rickettsiales bacterium]